MKKIIILKYSTAILLTLFFVFFSLQTVFAEGETTVSEVCKPGAGRSTVCLVANPLGVTAQQAIGIVIRGLLGIIGVLALIFFIYGGVLWMTAAGDEKKYKAGWETMTWATLGMVLVFGSSAIVSLILKVVGVE